jgi:uncharacterized NAD-dependent epimerase/dehydratase family protein
MGMLDPAAPLAVYMEGAVRNYGGKMGVGVLRYSPNPIACVIDSQTAGGRTRETIGVDIDVPIVASVEEALALDAKVFVLGIAPPGGLIPPDWLPVIDRAVEGGMFVVNGLHDKLSPRYGDRVWDVRNEPTGLKPGTGAAATLTNKRVLMVGTDMAVGKMTAGLEVWKALGPGAAFVATGQIGITVTGQGVPLDAIRLDFSAGAIEREVMRHAQAPAIVIEGQGSLVHPASTATLPLLRGSMPTHLILCARAGQTRLINVDVPIPPLAKLRTLYEDLAEACGAFARPRTVGIALNTFHIADDAEARAACDAVERELDLPCDDPVRHGSARLATF